MPAGTINRVEPPWATSGFASLTRTTSKVAQTINDQVGDVGKVAQDVTLTLARATYTGAYFMAYAAVVSAVLLTRALPKDNAVMRGFEDGGRAAGDALHGRERRRSKL